LRILWRYGYPKDGKYGQNCGDMVTLRKENKCRQNCGDMGTLRKGKYRQKCVEIYGALKRNFFWRQYCGDMI
jgi:hypothetical protein